MKANHIISIFLLPLLTGGSGVSAQSPLEALPNAPAVQVPLVAASTGGANAGPSAPSGRNGAPALLTRQDAEKIALANNPHIHISQLIAEVQHQAVRERRADELPP